MREQAYRQSATIIPTRIELILNVFDQLIGKLELARELLPRQPDVARPMLSRCQLALLALAGAQDPQADELSARFASLYSFAETCLREERIGDALAILGTLREAFEAIRIPALELERSGQIAPLDAEPNRRLLA